MPDTPAPSNRHAAVVYNPIKVDLPKLEGIVESAEAEAGWDSTVWLATTEEDAGQGMTKQALAGGAAVVLAAGGDGTVRAVAETLRDSGVPIALVPSGTGNLLARNLSLTLTNDEESIRVAFGSGVRTIDLGIAEIVREDDTEEQHVFLVMAGLGLDAKMIAKTSSKLKKAVGWLAYVDAGVRALPELKPVHLRYSLDGAGERTASVHTIMVGNCGMLPGGILLMPDAVPDDGILDIAVLQPSGPFGWLKVWNKVAWENGVLRKSALGRSIIDLTADVKDVLYFRGKDLRLTVETPQEVQLDGDEFGLAKSVHTWADAGALAVKVPAESSSS
ncbi:diacylglycerol/lipid kinase family protein [Lacisediminihabitans sp.]|uniref:diacylglycerol/lipid kinase family protein n=1 Tax=Lacisediminihabitans sp. TaxID=2787631 RepID=UPI002F91F4AF